MGVTPEEVGGAGDGGAGGEGGSVGGAALVTVKTWLEVTVPLGVDTIILPVIAPTGTTAVNNVLFETVKLLETAPNLTLLPVTKLAPVSVTLDPIAPVTGVNPAMLGAAGGGLVRSSVVTLISALALGPVAFKAVRRYV